MARPARSSSRRGRPPKDADPVERNANAKKSKYLFAGSGRKTEPAAVYIPPESDDHDEDDDCDENYTPVKSSSGRGRPSRAAAASASRSGTRSGAKKRVWEQSDDEEEDEPVDQDDELEEEPEFDPHARSSDQEDGSDEDGSTAGPDDEENDETEGEMEEEENDEDADDGERQSLRMTIRLPPKYLMEETDEDKLIPDLVLPDSSDDLLIKIDHVMQAVSIYEILRHFSSIVRLTPFRFEDFCAALLVDEQSVLLSEIHMMLLKALIREDEANGTHYTPTDLKDTVSINFFHTDLLTWPSALHLYLSADLIHNSDILQTCFQGKEYPFVPVSSKIKVLSHLCDLFLQTNAPREDVISEGIIKHDDNCRVCHKLGDLLCCETCPATFHLGCLDPPLSDVPTEEWICPVCRNSYASGVTDCISSIEKDRLLCRQEPLGWDRQGRRYWFLCRRIIVETEDGNTCWYYTTKNQLQLLFQTLDDEEYEADLVKAISEQRAEIERQMDLTERLTNQAKAGKKTYLEKENDRISKILNHQHEDGIIDSETLAIEDGAGDVKMEEEEEPVVEEVKPRIQTIEPAPAATSILALPPAPQNDTSNIDLKEEPAESKKDESVDEKKGILTRLKTGSIQPKPVVLDPLRRVNGDSSTQALPSGGHGDILMYSSDGESLTRIAKRTLSANPALMSKFLFKLGMEVYVKGYVNLYNSSATSLSRLQHQEERDRKRHLSHKFSLTPASEFKWQSTCTGSRNNILQALRTTLIHFEQQLPVALIHSNWTAHREKWEKAVRMCSSHKDFSLALCVLESCLKPVVFNQQWNEAIGFTHLVRLTTAEREENKKAEKRERKDNQEENEGMYKYNVHVHYVFGKLKHQIWKQKGEEYRLSGKGGWSWLSRTRVYRSSRFVRPEPTVVLDLTEEQQHKVANTPTINVNFEMRRKAEDRIYYATVYTGCWNSSKSGYTARHKKKMQVMEGLLLRREQQKEIEDRLAKADDASDGPHDIESSERFWTKCYSPLCRSVNEASSSGAAEYCGCYSPVCPQDVREREEEKEKAEQEKLLKEEQEYEDSINQMGACRDRAYCHKIVTVNGKLELAKRIVPSRAIAKGALPPYHPFETHRGKKKSILILPNYELKKLARCGSLREVTGFNYTCKLNHNIWPYHTTPRPMLRTSWLYRNQRIETIHQVALQLKVIWSNIRWDDLNQKPPISANTMTTETEVITTEILQRREIPPFGIRSEYLIRRIVVPIEMPSYKPREKATPIRSGLRERKRAESPQQRAPSMTESWHHEEELEIWELRQFGERLEKAMKDKETRKSLEEQVKAKTSIEAAKREAARVSQARGLLSTPSTSGIKTKLSNMIQSRVQNTNQPAYAMIKTAAGLVYKVPLSALQGKVVGQQIIIKTGSQASAMTTTAATIMSMHTNPGIPSTPVTTTSTTQALVTPQATITPVAQAPHNVIIRSSTPAAAGMNKSIVMQGASTTTPQAIGQKIQVIRPGAVTTPAGGQTMVTIPLKLPDGRTQMIQLPLSMLNQNNQVQIALQTPSSVQQPQIQTIQLTTPATSGATQVRITTNSVQAAITPTPQRIIQIRQPISAQTQAATSTSHVIQLSSPAAPQAVIAHNIVNQMKSGVIQLKLNPQAASTSGPIVSAPGTMITTTTAAKSLLQKVTIPTVQTPNVVTAASAASANVVRNPSTPVKAGAAKSGQDDFILTSASVQDVLAKALMNQNLPHEVQQKIMSVQKNYQEAGQDFSAPAVVSLTAGGGSITSTPTSRRPERKERPAPIFPPFERKEPNPAAVARGKASALKRKQQQEEAEKKKMEKEAAQLNMSPEQREDSFREEICRQALRGILDRIEKNEKNEQKRRKTREGQMQQRWKTATTKLNQQVARTADLLKKEMVMRRAQQEKKYRDEAENELENLLGIKIKKETVLPDVKPLVHEVVIAAPALVCNNVPTATPLAEIHQPKQQDHPAVVSAAATVPSSSAAVPAVVTPVKTPNKRIKITPTKAEIAAAKIRSSPGALVSPVAAGLTSKSPAKTASSPAKRQLPAVNQPPAKKPKLYCICQKAYDASRFMVGCDTCHNWFHGDCIGIQESSVEEVDSWVCDKCKSEECDDELQDVMDVLEGEVIEEEVVIGAVPIPPQPLVAQPFAQPQAASNGAGGSSDQELFCLCRKPYDESQFYICCDNCQDWFHGRCVGVLQKEADSIDTYVCPNCKKDSGINHANLKKLEVNDIVNLRVLLSQVKQHKSAWPFLQPVSAKEVPDYYKVIKDPMGLFAFHFVASAFVID